MSPILAGNNSPSPLMFIPSAVVVSNGMLDNNTLAQLKQLKQKIEDDKEYAEGTVKGTQRKFGFVTIEDGRDIYLAPDEMQKVFPGDRVKILVTSENNDKNKTRKPKSKGTIEALLESPLNTFNGRYVVKGQAHFVEPDLPRMTRWIFIPPSSRKGCQQGDYVRCRINRHPYPQGKPQAKVLEVIGSEDKIGLEADYMISKFQLDQPWPNDWQESILPVDHSQRQDLSQVAFVTIDSAATQDMDDGLYAQTTDAGWSLQVAIADPTAFVQQGSALEQAIQNRGSSCYLPRHPIPMLPTELANQQCSLIADQTRPALVCTIQIGADGSLGDYSIVEATVRSQAKLSYQDVSAALEKEEANITGDCAPHWQTLKTLQAISSALRENRRQHNLVIQDRPDYRLILNQQCKLDRIELQTKSVAHTLVEEAMVAANRCAADMLGESGIFISHGGFRNERLTDVKKLAEEYLSLTDIDFSTVEGYRQLMTSIDDEALQFPLRAVLSRLLERSRLSATRQPHQGMGLAAYTTFTSPIRKYSDFMVHRLIKAKLNQQPLPDYSGDPLEALQLSQDTIRQANYQLEQWLKCQFIAPMVGKKFSGQVSQINSNGFTVRLNDNYIEGFVETRLLKEKYSYDPMRMRLTSKSLTVELNQAIDVIVKEVDCKQRTIHYSLAAHSAIAKEV